MKLKSELGRSSRPWRRILRRSGRQTNNVRFIGRDELIRAFDGKRVALVGGGPSSALNERGFVDSHEVVVRINKYKFRGGTGHRTDIYYSYFGTSVRKSAYELRADGVNLCVCKCPDANTVESEWHRQRNMNGVDFRYIYRQRAAWWFCPTYIPPLEEFWEGFNLLGGHMTTTGFEAILQITKCNPKSLHITGFDFFKSKLHNLSDLWRPRKYNDDPVCHMPERELDWLVHNMDRFPITVDPALEGIIAEERAKSREEFSPTNFPQNLEHVERTWAGIRGGSHFVGLPVVGGSYQVDSAGS